MSILINFLLAFPVIYNIKKNSDTYFQIWRVTWHLKKEKKLGNIQFITYLKTKNNMPALTSLANLVLTIVSFVVNLPKKIYFKKILIATVFVAIILLIILIIKSSISFMIPIFLPSEYIDEKDFIIPPRWIKVGKTITIGGLLQLTLEGIIHVPDDLDFSKSILEEEDISELIREYVVVVRIEPREEIKFVDYHRENSLSGQKGIEENIIYIAQGCSIDFEHRNKKYRVGVLDILEFEIGTIVEYGGAKIKVSIVN